MIKNEYVFEFLGPGNFALYDEVFLLRKRGIDYSKT